MPAEPTPDQSSINIALSNFGVQALYLNPNFVANKIAPVVSVNKITGQYFVITPEEGLTNEHQTEIPHDGVATEISFLLAKALYSCVEHGKRNFLSDREKANADLAVVDYLKGDELILTNLAIGREIALADLICESDTYPGGAAGAHWFAAAAAWDLSTTDPADDIDQAVNQVELATGYVANTLLMPPTTYDILKKNDEVKDLLRYMGGIPYLQSGRIPGDMIWNLKIVKCGQVYDENAPLETSSLARIWERPGTDAGADWAWVGYVDPRPSIRSGGFAHQFAFNPAVLNDRDMGKFYVYYDDHRKGYWHEFRTDYDMRVTNSAAGAVITGTATAAS